MRLRFGLAPRPLRRGSDAGQGNALPVQRTGGEFFRIRQRRCRTHARLGDDVRADRGAMDVQLHRTRLNLGENETNTGRAAMKRWRWSLPSRLELCAASFAASAFAGCAPMPTKTSAPCVSAMPVTVPRAPPVSDVVHMANSGSLHLWALAAHGPPAHHYVHGLPADFELGSDSSAPTRLTVLEPLRFEAITMFPAYYLQKQSEQARPRVVIARGVALHLVARGYTSNCQAYVGFGEAVEARERAFDGTEALGHLLPDLELGPVEVPCDALGGVVEGEAPNLEGLA